MGYKSKFRKLTYENAQDIRARYTPYCKVNGMRALSREYGVDKKSIRHILNNEIYLQK